MDPDLLKQKINSSEIPRGLKITIIEKSVDLFFVVVFLGFFFFLFFLFFVFFVVFLEHKDKCLKFKLWHYHKRQWGPGNGVIFQSKIIKLLIICFPEHKSVDPDQTALFEIKYGIDLKHIVKCECGFRKKIAFFFTLRLEQTV